MVEQIALSLLENIINQYLNKIIEKAKKGKRLSDWEVGLLLIDYNRRILELRIKSLEKRVDALEARVDTLETSIEEEIEGLRNDMKNLEKGLRNEIVGLERSLRSDMEKFKVEMRDEITKTSSILENGIKELKDDVDYLKKSLDMLRDNVINVLVEELKRRI